MVAMTPFITYANLSLRSSTKSWLIHRYCAPELGQPHDVRRRWEARAYLDDGEDGAEAHANDEDEQEDFFRNLFTQVVNHYGIGV